VLPALERLPANSSVSVNCSPQLLLSSKFHQLLDGIDDLSRLVLEITEHAAVKDYKALAIGLEPYRRRGAKLAVDDAGAGYSSMRHILNLEPEIIKLDMSLTHSIDTDEKRRALARGLISFAHEIGSLVIAEGVERPEELDMLQRLEWIALKGICFPGHLRLMPRLCSRFTSRCAVGCVAAWAVASFKCLATDLVQQTGGLAGFVRLQALLVTPLQRA
jgi:EAL domain-containing protein (putative c-di-GMP-specific phosphodiesterase class I)